MRFRIQADGDKFRVQEWRWHGGWGCTHHVGYRIWRTRGRDGYKRVWEYQLFNTKAEAHTWIDAELAKKLKPKWRTI